MLVGVVGFIGSGKGVIGDRLVERYGYFKEAFANPLKDSVSLIFDWDRKMLEGDTDESRKWREEKDEYWSKVIGRTITPRLALQLFGTECIRDVFHQNVWSASLISRISKHPDKDFVVTDTRFRNEIKAIRDAGGIVIRVKRGEDPVWFDAMIAYNNGSEDVTLQRTIEQMKDGGLIPHVSETDWIGARVDYEIENNGTLEELYCKVEEILLDQIGVNPVS